VEKICVGIDLGTTNSCLAILRDARPVVLPNELGDQVTPSLVSILADGSIVIGKKARSRLLTHPANTFASIKRRMGERYARTVLGTEYTPESVSALILAHLKEAAEARTGCSIDDAVITVPANFNSVQRQATKDAGEIAGLNVLRVLNEPTAAALAYAHEQSLSGMVVVFDLGGGTFDISVVEAADGLYEVLYSVGDNHLGGDDFNLQIVQWIVREFERQSGLDIRRDIPAMSLVYEWAVAAKHALTSAAEVRVRIDPLYQGKGFDAVLTRVAFEEMCKDLFTRLRGLTWQVTEELQKRKYRDAYPGVFEERLAGCDILLVGGETRVPAVRQLVKTMFRGRIHADVNPDEVVALGAAVQAGIIQRQGGLRDIVLVDSTALSLGTAVQGELFSRVIDANTRIPCARTNEYVPTADYQPAVIIGVYQGESELVARNLKLGELELRFDAPRPREVSVVQVTFHLDANDILNVTARDKQTGSTQAVTIRDSQNLDRATVDRLRRDARRTRTGDRAEADRVRRRAERADWLRSVERRLTHLSTSPALAEHVQTASAFARQLSVALRDGDDDLADVATQDLEAALRDLPPPAADEDVAEDRDNVRAQPKQRTGIVRCGNCGGDMPPGYAFCGRCGVPLKKDACGACGAALQEGFRFCGQCGAAAD
jgi:molecular chaperone DnaK